MVYLFYQHSGADRFGCVTICSLGVLGLSFITIYKPRLVIVVNMVMMPRR